ncbi:hypothetical protein KY362_00475 [Candidatus Woesearchaeota archaeon]|nr:hypothetical protein [Candidatus Woesearchaeota archaeon]
MEKVAQILIEFFNSATDLATRISDDSKKVTALFKALEKDTTFHAVIEQRKKESDDFLDECHKLAVIIREWNSDYPKILKHFRNVVDIIKEELNLMDELVVQRHGAGITIILDRKRFEYNISKDGVILKDVRAAENDEEAFVKELADVLALDFHIEQFMEKIGEVGEMYGVENAAEKLLRIDDPNADGLVIHMHKLAKWWQNVAVMLDQIKKATIEAVKVDAKLAKKLHRMLNAEQIAAEKRKRLIILKATAIALSKVALALSGLTALQAIIDAGSIIKLSRETVKELKEL